MKLDIGIARVDLDAAKAAAEEALRTPEAREAAKDALKLAYDLAREALDSGNFDVVFNPPAHLSPLERAVLAQRALSQAWKDKDARDAKRRDAIATLLAVAGKVAVAAIAAAL